MHAAAIPPSAVALAVCALLGAATAAGARALAATSRRDAPRRVPRAGGIGRSRLAAGAAAGALVLLATRWPILAIAIAALVAAWGRLLRDPSVDEERARLDGIAKWLEDLRDTLRGSGMGAEEALEHVAARPPEAIASALHTFSHRRRQGFRTDDALADLGDDLAHRTADAAIAAIRLVTGGSASSGRLFGTVDALAAHARDEVAARERIDRTRAVYRSSMTRLVLVGALLVGYLRIAGGDLLQPYDTATGQVVLLVPLAMWLGCVLWLRALCRYEVTR